MQIKTYVNEDNQLEIIDKKTIETVVTFENSHLVAEFLISKCPNVAEALFQELKFQRDKRKSA